MIKQAKHNFTPEVEREDRFFQTTNRARNSSEKSKGRNISIRINETTHRGPSSKLSIAVFNDSIKATDRVAADATC
jgi:hypothetical protein